MPRIYPAICGDAGFVYLVVYSDHFYSSAPLVDNLAEDKIFFAGS